LCLPKEDRMADPATIGAVITGMVSLLSAYMTYRVGMKQAEQKGSPAPAKPDEATMKQSEAALTVVKQGVEQHGDDDERADLASFERNPQRYQEALARVLTDIATRSPAFAAQLQSLAQQANIQTGGVRGSVNVSGQGKVDQAAGVNTGTMTYHARAEDQDT
jgi:hypothetical protein